LNNQVGYEHLQKKHAENDLQESAWQCQTGLSIVFQTAEKSY